MSALFLCLFTEMVLVNSPGQIDERGIRQGRDNEDHEAGEGDGYQDLCGIRSIKGEPVVQE